MLNWSLDIGALFIRKLWWIYGWEQVKDPFCMFNVGGEGRERQQ